MVALNKQYNSEDNNDTGEGFDAIPAGEYVAMIVKSEWKRDGDMLAFQFKITEGDYKKRVLFSNLNLVHSNPTAVKIANQALNKICKACDKLDVEDSDELHGIPMIIKVSCDPKSDYPNNIKDYKKLESSMMDDDLPY